MVIWALKKEEPPRGLLRGKFFFFLAAFCFPVEFISSFFSVPGKNRLMLWLASCRIRSISPDLVQKHRERTIYTVSQLFS